MTLISIAKVDRQFYQYDDIYHTYDQRGAVVGTRTEPAPVEAFYELQVTTDGQQATFVAEVRSSSNGLHIDLGDELGDLMSSRGLPLSAWGAVSQVVFAAHVGEVLELPLLLEPR